jgi:hypothetical protein
MGSVLLWLFENLVAVITSMMVNKCINVWNM